jgi:hypothetical protein
MDGGELSASRPGRFIHRERVPSTHWIEDWVDPRDGGVVTKGKIHCPCRESNHGRPTPSLVVIPNELNELGFSTILLQPCNDTHGGGKDHLTRRSVATLYDLLMSFSINDFGDNERME